MRALLVAHLQATWNRSRRELGRRGRIAYIVVVGIVGLMGALPLLALSLVGGFFLGRGIQDAEAVWILGGILGAMTLLGGLAGGVSGGSRVLSWEAARLFPVRVRSLFLAELAAGLGDLLPTTIALASACLLLGAGAGNPRLLPLLPLAWAGTVGGLLCIQHLVGSLAARAVKRLHVGLVLLAILTWMALSILPGLAQRHAGVFNPQVVQALRRAGPSLGPLGKAAPPVQCVLGLQEAAQGRWAAALGRQAYPMAFLLLLFWATARVLARESDPRAIATPAKTGRERLWSFTTPARGVGRLHIQTLLSSHLGKFGFLVPLMVVVILKGPAAVSHSANLWSVPGGFAYLALSGVQMQLNQFGLDGPGVKALLLLPIRSADLLAGKALGLACYMGTQTLLLMGIMAAAGNLRVSQALPALCLSGCLFLYQVSLGHWTSAWLPRPMPRDSLRNHNVAPAVVWLGMAATLGGAIVFGGAWLLLAWLAPNLLLPVMIVLLAGMFLAYRKGVLPAAASYLDSRKETLVQALGRAG